MKEIRKGTKADLKEGEMVVVCKGGTKIPCVVRRCGNTPCSSCVLRNAQGTNECTQWESMVKSHSLYTSAAAFIPVEDIVE